MLEVRYIHELNQVCHFVMGLPTWAKHKLEENWLASLSKAHHKNGRFFECGMKSKLQVQEGEKIPS
jgi:hypothetical protein